MEQRVVITGLGVITPVGNNISDFWNNLVAGYCGIDVIKDYENYELPVRVAGQVKDFKPEENGLEKNDIRRNDIYCQYALAAAYQAMQDSDHLSKNTDIFIKNKVWAGKNSKSVLSGTAQINKNCENCVSDLSFTAMCEQGAKIDFMPAQKISSMPKQADHSASLYEPTDAQILYLRQAGLGILEIKDVTKEAFLNE